ncbi:MAG: class I SAM-dependent methyltransferase [Bacteroidetes bacterium]|nr:class I SAM-dependent methyltransferase [Bacteroidota bacterium]NCQ12233.1 class I SAM-dependent methyltransferase [Bacteroidota bacterium]
MIEFLNYKPSFNFRKRDQNQEILDSLYEYGDKLSTRVFHRMRINTIHEILTQSPIKDKLKPRRKALDIGCNCGYLSKLISEHNYDFVFGVDLADDFVQKAVSNFQGENVQFKTQDATQLDINDKYDLILCTEVIEHTDDPQKVIDSIYDLLADDGYAIISMPNRISLNYLTTLLGKIILRKPMSHDFISHISFPFYRTINLFKSVGFKVIKSRGVNVLFLENLLPFLYKYESLLKLDSLFRVDYP